MIEINHNPSRRDLRQFAWIWFPLFAAAVGLVLRFRFHLPTAGLIAWIIGAAVVLLGAVSVAAIKPIFIGMMYAAMPIGWVVTHVVLGALYYLLITPIGLVMKIAGRDTMCRRFDPQASSYWIPRPAAPEKERYFRQY